MTAMIRHDHEEGLFVRRVEGAETLGTIVYIHGLGESGLCFEQLVVEPRFRRWSHLVPDLLGYGRSPWRREPLTLDQHAERLIRWIERRVVDRCPVVILGHSMGGVVGMMMAERRADLFRAFVNVEGNVSLGDCTYSSQAAAHTEARFVSEEHARLLDVVYQDGNDDLAVRTYYPSLRLCDPRAFHLNGRELVELSRAETLGASYAELDLPQVYLLGSPGGTGERSRELLDEAGVTVVAIHSAGHWPFIDQRGLFIDEVERFLRQSAGSGTL